MTTLSTALAAFALLISLSALVFALRAAHYARSSNEWVEKANKRSRTLHELAELQAEMTTQADSIAAIRKSMHTLRSRIAARERNEKPSNGDGVPDPATDPVGWKRHMNAQLTSKG